MLLLYVNFALSDMDQDINVVYACVCVFSDHSNSEHNHHSVLRNTDLLGRMYFPLVVNECDKKNKNNFFTTILTYTPILYLPFPYDHHLGVKITQV